MTLTLGEPAHSFRRAFGPTAREPARERSASGEVARRSRLTLKALRRYDELGVLVPSRVDQASGYRYCDAARLDAARLVVMLRRLQMPLPAIRELLAGDSADAAARIAAHWRDAEAAHDARRDLASYLVDRLSGKRPVMYEVGTRQMPERSLLCLKSNVDEQGSGRSARSSLRSCATGRSRRWKDAKARCSASGGAR
ncbi:MAG: MerR family transcriptional regulator [Streptosporangiaceae bacterium]